MIIEDLASSNKQIRARAAWSITVHSCEGRDSADDPSDSLRLALESEWGAIPPDSRGALVEPLVRTLLEDESPLVVEIAAAALATQGEDGITSLLEYVDHSDFCIRSKAAIGAGLLTNSARWAIPLLVRAVMAERVSLVSGDLVRAISRIEDPMLFPALTELMSRAHETPDATMLVDQIRSAVRERRRREWPEANGESLL